MAQALSLSVTEINRVPLSVPQTFLINPYRMKTVFADPANPSTQSIAYVERNEGTIEEFTVVSPIGTIRSAAGTFASKQVGVTVVVEEKQKLPTPTSRSIQTSGFLYATADPANSNQSVLFYQEGHAMVATPLTVAHTLSALLALLNA